MTSHNKSAQETAQEAELVQQLTGVLAESAHVVSGSDLADRPFQEIVPGWIHRPTLHRKLWPVLRELFGLHLYELEVSSELSPRQLVQYLMRETCEVPHPTQPIGLALNPLPLPWDEALVAKDGNRRPSGQLERAAFVLSSPRSGSTLLRAMLGAHPALFAPPELNLLMFRSMGERRRLLLKHGQGWMADGLPVALAAALGIEDREAYLHCLAQERCDLAIEEVYRQLHSGISPRLLVDKSPVYACSANALQRAEQLYAQPVYIHLIRHPSAVKESLVRMRFHRLLKDACGIADDCPWQFAEKLWYLCNRNVESFLDTIDPSRILKVRYEDLVADPESVGRSLCSFLEVPWDASILSPHGDTLIQGIGDPDFMRRKEIVTSRLEAWRRVPNLHTLYPDIQAYAEMYGYGD